MIGCAVFLSGDLRSGSALKCILNFIDLSYSISSRRGSNILRQLLMDPPFLLFRLQNPRSQAGELPENHDVLRQISGLTSRFPIGEDEASFDQQTALV